MVTMKVKICGITNTNDARMAAKFGADALGFLIGIRHKSEDVILPEEAKKIISACPPFVTTVMVTHLLESESIISLFREIGTTAIQLHDEIKLDEIKAIRKALPTVRLIKAVHITDLKESLRRARIFERIVDAIVLDTINLKEDRIGGTGLTHDWQISKQIKESVSIPIILAGGLNPSNVQEAIRTVRPYAVDVNTGVKKDRYDRVKDPAKLKDFITKAKLEFLRIERK